MSKRGPVAGIAGKTCYEPALVTMLARSIAMRANPFTRYGLRFEEAFVFRNEVACAVASLPDDVRQMVELQAEGHTRVEIARAVGCSARTVTRRLQDLGDRMARKFPKLCLP
jgi:hypothetical protein